MNTNFGTPSALPPKASPDYAPVLSHDLRRSSRPNNMFSGVVVRSVECASQLGNEAVAAGLLISGLVEVHTFEDEKD